MNKYVIDWLQYMQAGNITNTLFESYIKTQMSTPEIFGGQAYVEFFKGYFFAPVNGLY